MSACMTADALGQAGVVPTGLPAEALRCQALLQFEKAFTRGKVQRIWRRLSGRPIHLVDLEEVQRNAPRRSEHYAGVQLVPIEKIVGSEGRDDEFTPEFSPLKHRTRPRWINVAMARLSGAVLPPVQLTQIGDQYYVLDGHHRISVAHSYGQREIEAVVTVRES